MSLFNVKREHLLTLRLPYPPSINNYYGVTRTGKRYIKKEGRDYRIKVVDLLRAATWDKKPLPYRLQVWIEEYPPDRRRRDLDNTKKALLDALTHAGIYEDDCLIDDLRTVRGEVTKGGYVRVFISKILNEKEHEEKARAG